MTVNFKKVVGILVALISLNTLSAQIDSADLDVSFQAPEFDSEMDSVFLVNTAIEMQEIVLTFELSDTSFELGKVYLELILLQPGSNATILFYNSYTPEELDTQNLRVDDTVSISFGWYDAAASYEIAIRLEDIDGNQIRSITKSLAQ
ncbi:MAG: hypothetical protein HYZ14_06340 [Bacteroidetes bacterium]|nr:hypothetical protein [Bacteroidota bacterium]